MLEICEATEDNPFIHGMSKQFVHALQQLFDVMDTDSSGTIKYCDIAIQWEEDQTDPFFPKGLISCLAKVTLPNGLLTFDRFCAGIKLCLLKNQVEINGDFIHNDFISDLNDNLISSSSNVHNANDNIPDEFDNIIQHDFDSNGANILSSQINGKNQFLNVQNNVPRPPSEPTVFAPAPPPSLLSQQPGPLPQQTLPEMIESNPNNEQVNHSSSISLNNITNQASQTGSTTTPSTAGTVTASESDDSINSPTKKKILKLPKRPLPTYEQVMAAKNNLKPTGLLNKITGIDEEEQNILSSQNEQNISQNSNTVSVRESSEITVNSLMLTLPPKTYHNNAGNNGVSKLFVKPTSAFHTTGNGQFQGQNIPGNVSLGEQSLNCSSTTQNYPQNLYENFNTLTSLTRSQPIQQQSQQQPQPMQQEHQAPQQQNVPNPFQQQQQSSGQAINHPITMVEPIYGQRAKSMTHLDSISCQIVSPTSRNRKANCDILTSTLLPDLSAPLSQRSQSMEQSSKSSHNLNGNMNSHKFLSQNHLGILEMNQNNEINISGNSNMNAKQSNEQSGTSLPKTLSRNYIMKTLQNWRDNILQNNSSKNIQQNDDSMKNIQQQQQQQQPLPPPQTSPKNVAIIQQQQQIALQQKSKSVHSPSQQQNQRNSPKKSNHSIEINTNGLPVPPPKPPLNLNRTGLDNNGALMKKRREPRRHTVGANGIDFYTVKRYQLLEQEKDILLRGLGEVEKTKDWFVRQISGIQDKINLVGRGQAIGIVGAHIVGGGGGNDCNIDAYQERINFQAARIANLNQFMNSIRDSGQNFPLHMNLAFRPFNPPMKIDPNSPKQLVVNPNLVNKLKEQNRLLTEEVGRKGERITQLEREKASLIRELFQARTYGTYYGNGTDFDDTLM